MQLTKYENCPGITAGTATVFVPASYAKKKEKKKKKNMQVN